MKALFLVIQLISIKHDSIDHADNTIQGIDSVIEWSIDRKLTKADFKDTKASIAGFSALSKIRFNRTAKTLPNKKYEFSIRVFFYPYKSWSVKNMTERLLLHEQVHFNMAELAVRKMRAYLRDRVITDNNFDSVILHLDKMDKDFDLETIKYDNETMFSELESEQLRWKNEIDAQLVKLKEHELKDGIELYKYRELIQQKPSADSTKEWQSKKLLKWSDFKLKDKPSRNFRAGGSTNIIFSSDTLVNGKYKFIIKAYFFPYKSWSGTDKSSSLLLHEQVHFNIAELVARKMRACIREVEVDNQNIDSLVWKILSVKKEMDALGKKHDKETANGRVKTRQIEWQKKIDEQLNQLKEYELKDGIELYKHKKVNK
jgi:hypothetical protein